MSNADLYLEYDDIQKLTKKEWGSRANRLINVIKPKVNEQTYYPTVVTLISDYIQQGQTRQRNFDRTSKEYLDIGDILTRLMKVAQDYGEGAKSAKDTAGRTQRPPYLSNTIADEDEEANRRALARTVGAKNKEKADVKEDLQPIYKEIRKDLQDFDKLQPILSMQKDPEEIGYLSPDNVIFNAQNIKNAFQELLEKDKFSQGTKEGTNTSQNLTNAQRDQINKKDDGFFTRLDRMINTANIKKDLVGDKNIEEQGKQQAEKSKIDKKGVPKDLLDELKSSVTSMQEDIKDLEGPEYESLPNGPRDQLIVSYKEQLAESKKILEQLINLENTKETDIKTEPIPPEVPEAKVGDEGQGIFKSELQDYLNRYKQIPTINLTTEITELIKQAEKALEPEKDKDGNILPSKVTLDELLPHRNYFQRIGRTGQTAKGLFTSKKPIDMIKERQNRSTANKLIDDSVREANKMNEQIKKEEEDVKMKDLRPDVEEGKEIYEGIDKEEKELTDQNQFLKHKLNVKDKEIELLKATIDQERNRNNLEFLNNTAPVFRKFLNIQLKDVFQEKNKDFVKSIF